MPMHVSGNGASGFMPMQVIAVAGVAALVGFGMISARSAAMNSCLRVIAGEFVDR
jgi:hypothetical protein